RLAEQRLVLVATELDGPVGKGRDRNREVGDDECCDGHDTICSGRDTPKRQLIVLRFFEFGGGWGITWGTNLCFTLIITHAGKCSITQRKSVKPPSFMWGSRAASATSSSVRAASSSA